MVNTGPISTKANKTPAPKATEVKKPSRSEEAAIRPTVQLGNTIVSIYPINISNVPNADFYLKSIESEKISDLFNSIKVQRPGINSAAITFETFKKALTHGVIFLLEASGKSMAFENIESETAHTLDTYFKSGGTLDTIWEVGRLFSLYCQADLSSAIIDLHGLERITDLNDRSNFSIAANHLNDYFIQNWPDFAYNLYHDQNLVSLTTAINSLSKLVYFICGHKYIRCSSVKDLLLPIEAGKLKLAYNLYGFRAISNYITFKEKLASEKKEQISEAKRGDIVKFVLLKETVPSKVVADLILSTDQFKQNESGEYLTFAGDLIKAIYGSADAHQQALLRQSLTATIRSNGWKQNKASAKLAWDLIKEFPESLEVFIKKYQKIPPQRFILRSRMTILIIALLERIPTHDLINRFKLIEIMDNDRFPARAAKLLFSRLKQLKASPSEQTIRFFSVLDQFPPSYFNPAAPLLMAIEWFNLIEYIKKAQREEANALFQQIMEKNSSTLPLQAALIALLAPLFNLMPDQQKQHKVELFNIYKRHKDIFNRALKIVEPVFQSAFLSNFNDPDFMVDYTSPNEKEANPQLKAGVIPQIAGWIA